MNSNEKVIINHETDYSNALPTVEIITYLVKFCDNLYKQLVSLFEEDEKKNEQYKEEFKEYKYKKMYSTRFVVRIREKAFNNIECKNYEEFTSAVSNGDLKQVDKLEIILDLDYKRGRGTNLEEHNNSFVISFNPYNITFARKSNKNDSDMDQIEEQIKKVMDQLPIANSIFCDKGE